MDIQLEFSLPLLLVTIPVLITMLVYYVSKKIFRHQWKAIHLSVQWTSLFYIIAVAILLQKMFHYQFAGMILISLILLLAIILIIQWKQETEVLLSKGLKVLSRISFLLFGFLYIVLISYEIIYLVYMNYTN